MTIYFDMDGTIANFYGVDGWLDCLMASDAHPYKVAEPLVNFAYMARLLNKVQAKGIEIGIISWLSKSGTDEFNNEIERVKYEWLYKHLPSVRWDEVHIVKYGYGKFNFAKSDDDILFDDEEKNRNDWTGIAKTPDEILETLKALVA